MSGQVRSTPSNRRLTKKFSPFFFTEKISKNPMKKYLEGEKVTLDENYKGLGVYFLNTLTKNLNKIHQIDTVTGVTETNGSVRNRAVELALELKNLGLVENDIILICSRCHADQTIAVLACLLIGCIVAALDSELLHKEFVNLVTQLKPKLCFCDLRTLKRMERIVSETNITTKMIHFGGQLQHSIPFQKLVVNKQIPYEKFKPAIIEDPRRRVAFILATQGSCGFPRLVCLSHHFIYSQVKLMGNILSSPQKIISYYPLSWIIQVILMCYCCNTNVTRVLTGAFAARAACKFINEIKIDCAFMNTELALQMAENVAVRDFNLTCLKCVFIGGLHTTTQDIKCLISRLPKINFIQVYCTTEVGIVVACKPDDYIEILERIGSTGKVVQNCKIRVVDIDTRKDVGIETPGELLVASDCLMLGYFKNLEFTKNSTQEGYFKTGDIARYDASGWIYIEGHVTDLLNIRGFRESPRQLEDTIVTHPFVKDAVVIGNQDEVVACVIIKPGTHLDEDTLNLFLADKLPAKKLPSRICFMTDFPTTPNGRIKRDVLKDSIFTVKIEHSMMLH